MWTSIRLTSIKAADLWNNLDLWQTKNCIYHFFLISHLLYLEFMFSMTKITLKNLHVDEDTENEQQ